MLQILVMLLQFHKSVMIEKLATVFPQPLKFASRRRILQRFLSLPQLNIQFLWFPVLKHWVKIQSAKKGVNTSHLPLTEHNGATKMC